MGAREAQGAFADLSAGAFVASFVGTMLMFLVPITLLGTVSPWAIRLSVTDVQTAGSVAGRLYAISTVGSILGTFLPVLVLIPAIGTRDTLILSMSDEQWDVVLNVNLRAVFLGAAAQPGAAADALETMVRGIVVVRGHEAMPVGSPIVLRLPQAT